MLASGTGGLVVSMLASGTGGLVVSMLASGTQDRGFVPDRSRRIFPAGNIHSMPTFGRGSKIICPMSQLWGMYKNLGLPKIETLLAKYINLGQLLWSDWSG
jgi:hypothetical protein